jgi:hypothetical protein
MTMPDQYDDVLDDLFQSCALHAYLEVAACECGWPSSEATRIRAYDYYEAELAKKNAAKSPPDQKTLALPDESARVFHAG